MADLSKIRKNGVEYNLKDTAAREDIEELKKNGAGGTVTDEQIAQAVVDYLTKNPVEGGMTKTEKNLILSLFRNAVYTSGNMGNTLTQLESMWNGGEAPDEPDVPAVTLTRISATYSGGSVPVGTAVSALTGIVVTASYSDGSSKAVTGYSLSGTIAEGSNIITVSYGGKSTTFTVTGVAEEPDVPDVPEEPEVTLTGISATYSGGNVPVGTAVSSLSGIVVTAHFSNGSSETVTGYTLNGTIAEGSNTITVNYEGKTATFTVTGVVESNGTDWTANEAYTNYNWIDGVFITDNGGVSSYSDYSASGFMPCAGVSTLMSSQKIEKGAFYDINKTYLSPCVPKAGERMSVPENAAFFRISGVSETVKTISIIPDYVPEVASGWEDGVPYVFENWVSGYCMGTYVGSSDAFQTSDYMPCYGAATLESGTSTKYEYCAWYDADKKSITRFGFHSAALVQTVPENASYFRISKATGAADPVITPHA